MEKWEKIDNFEYMISSNGEVKRLPRKAWSGTVWFTAKEKIIKPYKTSNGYLMVDLFLDKKPHKFLVHRLVAQAFIENKLNLPQVNHKNLIKDDNNMINLEWMTCRENVNHAKLSGKYLNLVIGEKNMYSKLDNKNVLEIRSLLKSMSQHEIAKIFKVSQTLISNIKNDVGWSHVK